MEASVAVRTEDIEAVEAQVPKEPAAPNADAKKMYRYSEYLDVGWGAAGCEHSRDGACEDTEHFHAWCRLPNPIQQENVRKSGAAAKARLLRLYKDPESDVSVVLDSELGILHDDAFRAAVIDELVTRDFATDYLEAQANVEDREEYEHIDGDREEFNRLAEGDKPEAEQSKEYRELSKQMSAYVEAIREELTKIQAPRREELESRSIDSLIELTRTRRVEEEGDRVFIDQFNLWQWFIGTFKVKLHDSLRRPYEPMWAAIGDPSRGETGTMFGEAPEVIEALRQVYGSLQSALQRGSSGN
jgi:hypothetical protein